KEKTLAGVCLSLLGASPLVPTDTPPPFSSRLSRCSHLDCRAAVLSPIARPAIQRPTIGLTIRVMPAVFKWQPVVIEPGEPRGQINLTHAAFRYPDPFDSDRNLTPACRDFVMQAVRDAARRDARKMWITWPDRSSTAFIGPDLTPTHQPSS
ncbi:hypothetical protein NZL82_19650, partial [Sphingomonas sanguinis]|uniref:hypothetical protein n=1 Tax=Sphingomonas sp. LC-1 TaxID=3110957 RepID=UPI0021BACFF1